MNIGSLCLTFLLHLEGICDFVREHYDFEHLLPHYDITSCDDYAIPIIVN